MTPRDLKRTDERLFEEQQYHAADEIEVLESLDSLGEADAHDLNQLGVAYENCGNLAKAIDAFRRSAIFEPDPAPLFNLGLALSHPEISRDADAADAYRRALFLNPSHDLAKERLDATKQKLRPLATRARSAAIDLNLIQKDEHFQFYLSPFEVFRIEDKIDPEVLDARTIQRGKQRLLQEIDLNDGKVSWLDNYPLDRSRAFTLEDELLDKTKRRYHWAVSQKQAPPPLPNSWRD